MDYSMELDWYTQRKMMSKIEANIKKTLRIDISNQLIILDSATEKLCPGNCGL
jgi:hypothetical protein